MICPKRLFCLHSWNLVQCPPPGSPWFPIIERCMKCGREKVQLRPKWMEQTRDDQT